MGGTGEPANMRRVVLVLCVMLVVESCRDAQTRSDAGGASGGMSGAGPSGGGGGAAPGGGSGGSTAGSGFGGVTSVGGSTGTGVDAFVSPPSDGSAAGEDGSTIDAPPDGGKALEPIRVSEATVDGSQSYSNLRIVGVGLDQYEGAVVTFRIGSGNGFFRFDSGQVRIVQGAFDVLFTAGLAPVYEPKLVHIDADGSGACEVGEPIFLDSALLQMDTTLTVTPTDFRLRPAVSGWCDTINAPPPY